MSKTRSNLTYSSANAPSDGVMKIVVTTAESRTGDAILQEAERLGAQGGKFEICGLYPPTVQPLQLQHGKTAQIDVVNAAVSDLAQLLQGVDTIILIPPASQDKVQLAEKLTTAAVQAGVPNVILISDLRLNHIPNERSIAMFGQIEEMAKELAGSQVSSMTIVRAGHYMQNLFLYAAQMQREGALGLPTGDGKMAPVDARDVALITLRIASEPGLHNGKVYNLSGAEALSGAQMMAVARKAGLPEKIANFKNITDEQLAELYRQIPAIDPSEGERNIADFRFIRESGGEKVFPDAQKLATEPLTTLLDFFTEYQGIFLGTSS